MITFSPEKEKGKEEKSILSVFKISSEKDQIEQGMSPIEIAEIVSNRLADLLEKQMEEGKRRHLQNKL